MGDGVEMVKDNDGMLLVGWVSDWRYGLQWMDYSGGICIDCYDNAFATKLVKGRKSILRQVWSIRGTTALRMYFCDGSAYGQCYDGGPARPRCWAYGRAALSWGGCWIEKGRGSPMRADKSTSSEPA